MPKLIVNGIPVVVEVDFIDEFCDKMEEKNFQVSKADEWVLETKVCFILFYFF